MTDTSQTGGIHQELTQGGGGFKKYRSIATGDRGFLYFLFYEFLNLCCIGFPTQVGRWKRRLLYRGLFGSLGCKVRIGKHVLFRRPASISLGHDVTIGDHTMLVAKSDASSIVLHDRVLLGDHVILSCNGGSMALHEGVRVGSHSRLGSLEGLEVGKNVTMGERVCVSGAGHAYDRLDVPIIMQPLTCNGPTKIGEGAVIGDGATLLDGVTVGEGAIVEPATFVNKDVPAGAHVAGVPAKEVGTGNVPEKAS